VPENEQDGGLTNIATLTYKEYVRLCSQLHEQVKISFDDFRLLGAIAPIGVAVSTLVVKTDALTIAPAERGQVLFIAFMMILLIVVLIGFRDLMRQSVIIAHMIHLAELETEMRTIYQITTSQVFSFNIRSFRWFLNDYRISSSAFFITFTLLIVFVPAYILWTEPSASASHIITYLTVAVISLAGFLLTFARIVAPLRGYADIEEKRLHPAAV
jgi:hypothetical protein